MEIQFFTRSTKKITNVRVRMTDGRPIQCYAKTNVVVESDWWDNKAGKPKVMAPVVKKQSVVKQLSDIEQRICDAYILDKHDKIINSDWLKSVILPDTIIHPVKKEFFMLWDEFMSKQKISINRRASYTSLRNKLERFALVNGSMPVQPDNALISALNAFILNEHLYVKKYPKVYIGLTIELRGQNYVNDCIKKYKTFIRWAHFMKHISYNPFNPHDYTIQSGQYADPVPLSKEELEFIADATDKVPDYLDKIRDMFVLQCYTGCRIGDFILLKRENVTDGVLSYIPGKTINETQETLYIPLSTRAIRIIDKYNQPVKLFPFINISGASGYNKGIKLLFKHLKIDRKVSVIDSVTREKKMIPICEVVSSHTARRTFASVIYNATGDWVRTASMTGHSQNSKAAERYRKAQLPLLKETIKKVFD